MINFLLRYLRNNLSIVNRVYQFESNDYEVNQEKFITYQYITKHQKR